MLSHVLGESETV